MADVTINGAAPVVSRAEIRVDADIETVWDVASDIDRWPSWNPAVKSASLSGPLAEGSRFRWKAGPGTITSTLLRVEKPRVIAWKGSTFGIDAIHVYRLEPRDGGTVVGTEESWEGLVVRLLRSRMQKMLDAALDPGLRALKAESERRTAR